MKLLSKLRQRVSKAALLVSVSSLVLVPIMGVMQPVAVHAVTGNPLTATGVNPTTTVTDHVVGAKLNSTTAYDGTNLLDANYTLSSDDSVYGVVSVSVYNDKAVISCYIAGDSGKPRDSYSWSSSDYANLDSGVTGTTGVDDGAGSGCGLTYTASFVTANDYTFTLDNSVAGTVTVKFQDGSSSAVTLGDIAINLDTTSDVNLFETTRGNTCADIPAVQYDAQILASGSPVDLSLNKDDHSCANFDASTYDSATKTATVKILAGNTSGVIIKHNPTNTADVSAGPTHDFNFYSSLDSFAIDGTNIKNVVFKDDSSASSSAAQQVYLAHKSDGSDGFTKDDQYPIAGAKLDFSAGDIDFKDVTMASSLTTHTAFAHNLNLLTSDGSFTLYVPFRTGDKFVGVCAGATALTAVSNKCTGIYYVKDGQTKTNKDTKSIPAGHSVTASTVTIAGIKYWQVDGLTGTGAFSSNLASDPETGLSVSTTSIPVVVGVMIATIGVAFAARRKMVPAKIKAKR